MMTDEERDELAAEFLRKLALADMKAWSAHWRTAERAAERDPDDALSSKQAQKIAPRAAVKPAKTKAKRSVTFYGRPCRCGSIERYISTGNCVACHKIAVIKSEAKRAAAKRAESSASSVRPSVPRLAQFNSRRTVSNLGRGKSIPQVKDRQYATR
jgi:hypothetical protein